MRGLKIVSFDKHMNKVQISKKAPTIKKDIDRKELELGMKTESEHTNDKNVQKKIANDHLKENPNYYTDLKKSGVDTKQGLKTEYSKKELQVGDKVHYKIGKGNKTEVTGEIIKKTYDDKEETQPRYYVQVDKDVTYKSDYTGTGTGTIEKGEIVQPYRESLKKESNDLSHKQITQYKKEQKQYEQGKLMNDETKYVKEQKEYKSSYDTNPQYRAKVDAEERYYNTADERYEKNLKGRKVISSSQADDLVEETPNKRVWVSRVTGEVSTERLRNGRWQTEDN